MPASSSPKDSFKGRTQARLAAVQALFQIEQTGDSASSVIMEFLTLRLSKKKGLSKPEIPFFIKLVEEAWKNHAQKDEMICGALKPGWTIDRIEPVTRAILRAALYELCETRTSPAIIMDEYLTITHNFFDRGEVAFVNGVLNTISQKVRPSIKG